MTELHPAPDQGNSRMSPDPADEKRLNRRRVEIGEVVILKSFDKKDRE